MDNVFTVEAKWHEYMRVTNSDDILGLVLDACHLNQLRDLLKVIISELLGENSHLIEQGNQSVISSPVSK